MMKETSLFIQNVIEMDDQQPSYYVLAQQERALIRAKAKRTQGTRSELSSLLNMQKLREGDNDEWRFFMTGVWDRLMGYTYRITFKARFCEDIVANTIAHMYENRALFDSGDYFMGYMFNYARFESFQCMKRGEGNTLVLSEIGVDMSWYIESYISRFESMSMQERMRWDEMQDIMIDQIMTGAERLPRRWKGLIRAYLVCQTMGEVNRVTNKAHTGLRASAFQQLKKLIQHQDFLKQATDEQLKMLRYRIQSLSPASKKVIKRILQGKSKEEIADELWPDAPRALISVNAAMSIATCRIREVWPDPALSAELNYAFTFFSSPKGYEVDKIFKEEILDKEDSSFTYVGLITIGKKRRAPTRKINSEYLSNENWTESDVETIYEHRMQGASWRELEDLFGTSTLVMKRLIQQHYGTEIEGFAGRRVPTRDDRLTFDEVREIRRKYAADKTLSARSIAREHNLSAGCVLSIVNGERWHEPGKEPPTDLTLLRDPTEKNRRIVELAAQGKTNKKIAEECECSEAVVSTVLKKRGIETAQAKKHKEWERKVVAMAKSGMSTARIRREIGGRSDTVRKVLEENYPQYYTTKRPSPKRSLDLSTEEKIRKAYSSGESTPAILARIYKVHKSTIHNIIKRPA